MKICSKCGNILKDDDVFCSRCGAKTSIFGVVKKSSDKASVKDKKSSLGYGKLRADTLPGDRYTAAVEQNTIAVTEYLKRASDLEWQRYELEEIGKELEKGRMETEERISAEDEAIMSCENKIELADKQLKDYKKLEYRRKVFNYKFHFDLKIFGIILAVLLVIFFGGRAAGASFLSEENFSTGLAVLLIVLIPVLAVLVIQAVKYFRSKAEHEKQEDEATLRYSEEQEKLEKETIESLNNDIKDYENIIKEHKNEKARLEKIVLTEYQREIEENQASLVEAGKTMEAFYDGHALYPKYRSLIPVATMYSFFDSGRCIDLTGHDGAYGYYEKELRYKNITEDLSEILEKSEDTRGDQTAVGARAEEIKKNAERLVQSVKDAIDKNLEANPDGFNVSSRLKHSADLQEYRDQADSMRHDYMEYSQSLRVSSRRWF